MDKKGIIFTKRRLNQLKSWTNIGLRYGKKNDIKFYAQILLELLQFSTSQTRANFKATNFTLLK
jgi:hypothetical protein